jgi:hypothetical protein
MHDVIYIPTSLKSAGGELRKAFASNLGGLSKTDFIRAWASIAYLFPGLHPDGYEDKESGWPKSLRRFADEACRRVGDGEMTENELYQSDAQWCGIYDRLKDRRPDEIHRRLELASLV